MRADSVTRLTVSRFVALAFAVAVLSVACSAQQGAANSVPHLVSFAGNASGASKPSSAGIFGVTFALYREPEGGAPLWLETQNVPLDAQGHYSVQLGATKRDGIPVELFAAGESRWLEVRVEGQAAQARVLLVSVPYALKAADADTIGGRPASAFVLAPTANAGANENSATPATLSPALGGAGTANFVPLWTPDGNTLGSSFLFQSGSGTTAKLGVNTATPTATLDVRGSASIRGLLNLTASGTATALTGKNSQSQNFIASAFNNFTSSAVNQFFRLQAEPVGNNSATPSASLNLLFGQGNAIPAETGLKIASNGQITFASGQTFPGTGTVTGITAGSGLTGGGTSGNVSLGLTSACASGQVLQWNGSSWLCKTVGGTGTVTSVGLTAPASDFTVSGSPITSTGTLGLNWRIAPTSASTANAIVKRDAAGSFSVNGLTATGSLSTQGNLVVKRADSGGSGVRLDVIDISTSGGSFAIVNTTGNAVSTTMYSDGTGAGPLVRPSGIVGTFTNHPLGLMTNDISRIYIDPSGAVGIPTNAPQALLNVNQGSSANSLLVGSLSKGIMLRDTGTALDLESLGAALWINNTQLQSLYLNPSGGSVAVGTTGTSDGAALTVDAGTTNVFGLEVFGSMEVASGNLTIANGSETILGDFKVYGTKNFRIDHPLDPENKYLEHAAIESSEVLNLYSGNVTLDAAGEATVTFPAWFHAINVDFRYQLTAVDAPGPNLYIAEKIKDDHFRIAGGKPGAEVSWQVTCRRNDRYMQAHPFVVEEDKPASDVGYYDHPELYGQPAEKGRFSPQHATAARKLKAASTATQALP